MVSGPGVYVCDECVALADRIVSEALGKPPTQSTHAWNSMTDEEILHHLPSVAAHIDRTEAELHTRIQELRRRGVTWTRIGDTFGITRQSAWERFSGEERQLEARTRAASLCGRRPASHLPAAAIPPWTCPATRWVRCRRMNGAAPRTSAAKTVSR
ncbi:hypothetical protein ACHGLA_00020 [Streptomyces sp. YH02]|uniref:hypothetical protein n=1 Tax=Streptomyces sp. YH02 TaxID=3256999 RepID=UPI0037574C4B